MPDGKRCRKCGAQKDAAAFPVNRAVSDGLSSWCRDCHRDASKASHAKYGSAYNRKRRERQVHRAALMQQGQETRAYVQALYADPCAYCGGPAGETDHIKASSQGGANDWGNLTAACRSCNAAKKDMALLQFLMVRPLWRDRAAIDEQIARLAA